MIYCANCGASIDKGAKFCSHCGSEIINKPNLSAELGTKIKESTLAMINNRIAIQNSESRIVKRFWYATALFFILMILPFQEWSPVAGAWALAFISFFLFLVSISLALLFRSREKKLEKLITGESLLAHWYLTPEQKKLYVNYLFKQEVGKNRIILFSISFIAIIVFSVFILVIDEGKWAMFLVLVGLILFLSLFAFGMPYYYRYKNNKADANILIGAKYAYINGFFHNWDFPLSGLSKIRIIEEPFYGINLTYYYTDRTFKHREELIIPADKGINLTQLIQQLKALNNK